LIKFLDFRDAVFFGGGRLGRKMVLEAVSDYWEYRLPTFHYIRNSDIVPRGYIDCDVSLPQFM
jgi:hypothetical protein